MSVITDNIGNWFQLGTVAPTEDWTLFTEGAINGRTFRFTYITNWEDWESNIGFWSYGLLRFYYRGGEGIFNTVSQSVAIYPKRQQEIRELVTPNELQSSTYVIRVPGIKMVRRFKPYPKASVIDNVPQEIEIIPWQLKLEYLL